MNNNFWSVVKEEAGGILPDYLKLIIEENGYGSFLVLQSLDDDDIQEMEIYGKTICNAINSNLDSNNQNNKLSVSEDFKKKFSDFENSEFKMYNGYKKYLKSLKNLIKEKGLDYFCQKLNTKKT